MREPSALLLAAGRATRLGELRERHAKACVPVAGVHPLAFLLGALREAGVRRFLVNLHWRAEEVRREAEAAAGGAALDFLEEPELLGTGGTLAAAARRLGASPDLVVNAKFFGDLPWRRILAAPPGTLVLHPPSDLRAFGGFLHDGRRIHGLLPRAEAGEAQRPDAAVYTGVARPAPAWLAFLEKASTPACLVRDGVLPALAAGRAAPVLLHRGLWHEISTPERVAAAAAVVERLRAQGRPPEPA